VTDRTLLVSGDACARASASVIGASGRGRERTAHTRTATTASRKTAIATASVAGNDISLVLRAYPCVLMPCCKSLPRLYQAPSTSSFVFFLDMRW
jgi:hypothetical protein